MQGGAEGSGSERGRSAGEVLGGNSHGRESGAARDGRYARNLPWPKFGVNRASATSFG